MNKDKQSYSAPDKEPMFHMKNNNSSNNDGADNRNDRNNEIIKLYISLNKELKEGVNDESYEKIKQILDALLLIFSQKKDKECEEEIERQRQELNKENEKRKKTERVNRRIVIIASLVWIAFVTFLFPYILNICLMIFGGIGSIIAFVITFIMEANSKDVQDVAHIKDENEPITTGIVEVCVAIAHVIKKESLLHLTVLVCVTTMLGMILGRVGVIENAKIFIIAGCTAVKDTDEEVILATRVNEEVEEIILSGCDEITINMLQQADVTQAELDTIMELSQEDYDLVFYLNLEDLDWTDQNAVNEAVSQMTDERRSMKMENEFDKDVSEGGAPQQLRDLVYQASEDEKKAKSFNERKAIRDIRADAFEQYPKKSLANLLSNDYQKLAIILYLHGGNAESIVYYYSQSILRDFECLQFAENSNDTVKDKLISIAQRYKDMIYTCPNMKGLENAQALAEAFENAANQY